jgi:hypothetical protein
LGKHGNKYQVNLHSRKIAKISLKLVCFFREQKCTNEDRFFLNYQNQKCARQPVDVNKLGSIPKQIAIYLNLKNPELYTGYCFRRSSATILVDAGGDMETLKNVTMDGNLLLSPKNILMN